MKTYSVQIREVTPFGQEHGIEVTPALPTVLQPGQYCLAFAPGTAQILPISLFPCGEVSDGLSLCGKLPPVWHKGMHLLLQGPLGQGFIDCLKARKLVIHAVDTSLESRLYSLAAHALQRGADVAWVTDQLTIDLPPQVEVLKSADFEDAVAWGDACALALPANQVSEFQQAHALKPVERTKIEILLDSPLMCGNSHCGVCAVETIKGWKLACKEGPVFRLEELPRE
jgi:NAD(P)H-flavin reductase